MPVQQGPVVPVVTPGDSPAPPGQDTLPLVLLLQDGREMRRRRKPVIVNWGPKGDLEDIMMLQVFPLQAPIMSFPAQAWRSMDLDLGQFRNPLVARAKVEEVDTASGEGLTRLEVVLRGVLEQFREET